MALLQTKSRDWWFVATLAAITGLGLFLRFYQLDELPTGLFFDEAMNGLDAIDTLNQTGIRVWIPDNFARGLVAEGLMSHVQAIAFSWFGVSIAALRAPSALAGAFLVPFVGLLTRELFRTRLGALAAAFLAATSSWALLLSRQAYPAPLVPLCAAAGTYFAVRGVRRRQTWALVLAGVIFGAGFYSYAAYRVMPLFALVGILVGLWVLDRQRVFRATAWMGGAALVTAAPMLWAFRVEPGLLSARAGSLSVLGTQGEPLTVVTAIGRNSLLAALKYHVNGDLNWRYNISGEPLLDPALGALFLIGLVIALVLIVTSLRAPRRSMKRQLGASAALVVAGLLITQLPEILANEGNPHALRSIGSQAFVFPLAGLAVGSLLRWARSWGRVGRGLVSAGVGAALLISSILSVQAVFGTYRNALGHHNNSQTYLRTLAEFLASSDFDQTVAIVKVPLYDRSVIEFLAPDADVLFAESADQARAVSIAILPSPEPGTETTLAQGRWLQKREVVDLRPGTNSEFVILYFSADS